jgi:predicted ATPase/class 3 adenylate cyclase
VRELPSGTVTFLFTDIEGSTRLLQHVGHQRYRELLEEHRRLLRSAFTAHGGVEVETEGDGFFVAFGQASDAVAACLEAQRAVVSHDWPDGIEIRVRMGAHTGEAVPAGVGYVSLHVHQAARIAAAAHGGQVLFSEVTGSLVAADLPDGVELCDLGDHRLKDFDSAQRLFQLCHPDLPREFPPVRSLRVRRHNLPAQLTNFIGREEELAELVELLSSTRLLTITGTGGAGKTRLGLQLASAIVDGYPDGAWFAELAPLADPGLVPQQVASALQLRDEPGRTLTETIVDYLRTRELLLVLDNCEHLVDAAADLAAALLVECDGLRILATSRQPLGLPGEQVWRIPSLPLPEPGVVPPPEELMSYDAVRLFVDRATLVDPRFRVTRDNTGSVLGILRHLDGIPLAIELAAARLRVLGVNQLAARLTDRFRVLTGGSRALLPRQRTLRALVDWSYDLLSEPEQALLRRTSLFAGGFSLIAAEDICAGDGLERDDVLDLLTQLVDKSLVVVDPRGDEDRYGLLETIRQYGGERLVERGEGDAFQRRYVRWYFELGRQAEVELVGPDQAAWLDRLETEHDNIRQVVRTARELGDLDSAYGLAAALWRFWWIRGYLGEGRSWLDGALSDRDCQPEVRAKALHAAGALAWDQSDYRAARYFLSESISLFQELGDENGVAGSTYKLASVFGLQGDNARARHLLEENLESARHRHDGQGVAQSLIQLVQVAMQEGRMSEAKSLSAQSLAVSRELGDTYAITASLAFLGEVALAEGAVGDARRMVAESLEGGRALGDKWRIARALHVLGEIACREGDCRRAAALHRDALRTRREIGQRDGIVDSLESLADLAARQEDWERAARLLGAAEALRDAIGAPVAPGRVQDHARFIAAVRTELDEAEFDRVWQDGQAMSLDQAIAYAYDEDDDARSVAA